MPLPYGPTVNAGDLIMIIGKDRRSYVRAIREGGRFECHFGYIDFDDLIGVPYGAQVQTHIGHKMFILPPNTDDVVSHLQRHGQIIFPKDLGYIMLKLGIRPGVRVIEAGTGSGALTSTLALLVGDEGHVYSYERRENMQQRAAANIRRLGLEHRVTFYLRDIANGFDERDANALFLDVREPWQYLGQAREALQGGGFFGTIVPTINQVVELLPPLYDGPWFLLEIEELLRRTYKTIPERIRPDEQMVGHTGFLVFARAVEREDRRAQEDTPVEDDETKEDDNDPGAADEDDTFSDER